MRCPIALGVTLGFTLTVAVPSVIHAGETQQLAPMEIQAIQQREYEADKPTVFASVVDVLQDLGFTINSADLTTGFITASSPVSNTTYSIWWGRATGNTRVTAFIETVPNGKTRARLNFVTGKNQLGWTMTMEHREKAVLDPKPYNAVFEKVSEALFVRKSMTGAPSPGTLPPAATTPATTAGPTPTSAVAPSH